MGHTIKFLWFSGLGFVTSLTSLNGGQPNFARFLAVFWAGTLYIQFRVLLPLTEFYQVQYSLCVQVLRFPIGLFAALLHRTPVVGVSKTLRRSAEGAICLRQSGPNSSFIMVALCNRADRYIFMLWFLFFFSSPNLSGRTLDVYHTSTHGVA